MVWIRGVTGAVALALTAGCASGQGSDDGDTMPDIPSTTTQATTAEDPGSTAPQPTTDPTTTATTEDASTTIEVLTDPTTTTSESASTSSNTDSDSGDMPGSCGDGMLDADEACDDGNTIDGDGCNADCQPSGQVSWSMLYGGGLGLPDEAMGCDVDGTGSIHVVGAMGVAAGSDQFWVSKVSAEGDTLWTQTQAGSAGLKDSGRAVVVDAAEFVYAAGALNVIEQGDNVFVRKYAADGTALWSKSFNGSASLNDVVNAAAFTPDGGLLVGGATGTVDTGTDTWLRKYTSDGDAQWTRSYNGTAGSNDATHAVALTADGYIYAAGQEQVPGEGSNIWLGKYDGDGNLLWSRLYNGGASKSDIAHGAVALADGSVVICGYEGADDAPWYSFVRRYDGAGLTVWTEVHEGPEAAGALCYGLSLASNGDLLVAGAAMIAGYREPWLRRLDQDGNEHWATVVVGAGNSVSHARCLKQAPDGTLVAAGGLDEGVDSRDVWIARLSP